MGQFPGGPTGVTIVRKGLSISTPSHPFKASSPCCAISPLAHSPFGPHPTQLAPATLTRASCQNAFYLHTVLGSRPVPANSPPSLKGNTHPPQSNHHQCPPRFLYMPDHLTHFIYYRRFGRLVRCDIPTPRYGTEARALYAFIEFEDWQAAEEAFRNLHGKPFGTGIIKLQWARSVRRNLEGRREPGPYHPYPPPQMGGYGQYPPPPSQGGNGYPPQGPGGYYEPYAHRQPPMQQPPQGGYPPQGPPPSSNGYRNGPPSAANDYPASPQGPTRPSPPSHDYQ